MFFRKWPQPFCCTFVALYAGTGLDESSRNNHYTRYQSLGSLLNHSVEIKMSCSHSSITVKHSVVWTNLSALNKAADWPLFSGEQCVSVKTTFDVRPPLNVNVFNYFMALNFINLMLGKAVATLTALLQMFLPLCESRHDLFCLKEIQKWTSLFLRIH